MNVVNQSFQSAPLGRRCLFPVVLVGAVMLFGVVGNVIRVSMNPAHSEPGVRVIATFAPMLVLLGFVGAFLLERSRSSHFRIEGNALVICRKRYPLEGLLSVERDRDVLRWAVKLWGNGGLGAIRGKYWSKRIGKFDALLTDTDHAVLLRWPGRVVAVSPSDPEFFMQSAREAAGLR